MGIGEKDRHIDRDKVRERVREGDREDNGGEDVEK